ncbi:MAG: DMT family transporter [Candidatus Zixiibacteriota bacterium]|nr:MAG: DMT family transporter [candidate division Zixibacteria bacterium]
MLLPAIITLQLLDALCFPVTRYGTLIIEPYTFAFFRFTVSSLILLAIVRSMKHLCPIERRDWWRIIVLAVLVIPLNQMLYMVGQARTAAGHGAFLYATAPVWIFVLAIIHLKEKVLARRAAGIVLAFAGVMTIMLGGKTTFGVEYLWGDIIIFAAVLGWSYYTVLGKPLVEKYGALRMTAYAIAIGSALYFPFGLYRALKFDYSGVTAGAWGAVAFMALGMSVALYGLWYWVLKYMEASRLAIWHNMFPVISAAVAYFTLGEPLTGTFVVGGIMVLGGVTVNEL